MQSAEQQERIKELEEAFALFNQTSERLTESYNALQKRTADLQDQLAQSDLEKKRMADRLSRLLQLLPASVVVLDRDNRITEMNPSAEKLLGEDATGRTWPVVQRNVFLEKNSAGELVTHQGQVFQLANTALDQEVGRILLLQDVTDARRLQEHVSRHQRLTSMGEMAASLAHQIRTPLSSALLYVSQLNAAELTQEQREKFALKVQNSLHHLESLVQDMLQYAKGGKSSRKPLSVEELIALTIRNLEERVNNSHAHLSYDHSAGELQINGDMDGLSTALQNLVNNALDHIPDQALIRISVKRSEEYIDIIVSDNGPGIEAENLHKVFEPFYTSRAKGTGLGLAVVRAVAEAHHGEAWVKSIVGYGSQFGIRLPLEAE
ncbi:PAS domain-containing sensor histidine kinase [Thiomicrorhabdus sp. 6S3-12]|uniref:sensor histidine kinase n=1 Tax=Thiomicrorhabdus sp. 6S3-12 TaxID=2819681 RepID=UPI001AAD6E50|nr:ATP-binding protein [Thiomicrorhabdus sp. 6S3-12]MBO1924525.1 PAS domain-containing protein [Thiomicrorhabdus sp. 6S3-12]